MTRVTSIRLSDQLAEQVEQLADSLDRPKSWLIEQAIRRYVEEEAAQIAAVREALTAYQSGDAVMRPHDQVMARLAAKLDGRGDDADSMA